MLTCVWPPANLSVWEDIRNAGQTGHEQLSQWGHPVTQFITLSSEMTNGGANRRQGFVYSLSQGPLRPGTLGALMFPPFVPLSSQGWPPEWSLYFIYLLGWKKKLNICQDQGAPLPVWLGPAGGLRAPCNAQVCFYYSCLGNAISSSAWFHRGEETAPARLYFFQSNIPRGKNERVPSNPRIMLPDFM